jgi:hypothetical protein
MKVAARPAFPFFSFFPIRESFLSEPTFELMADLIDFFFVFPFTRLPICKERDKTRVKGVSVTLS